MKDADKYINDSCLAVSKLMEALSSFEQTIAGSLVKMTKTCDLTAQTNQVKNIQSQMIPKEAIAGAILQIAFMNMKLFPKEGSKNETVKALEAQVIKTRKNGKPPYQLEYCVGREIEGIPIGLLIYAARNRYNHQDEPASKLHPRNRIIFQVLDQSFGNIGTTELGFDLYSEKQTMYAYSIVMLLGWTYTVHTPDPISIFRSDLKSIMEGSKG